MNLFNRINLAYKTLTTKSLSNSVTANVLRNYSNVSDFRPYEQVAGITYKAIDKIGQSLSVYEPVVNRKNGDAFENHPLYALFHKPNPMMNATDFVHMFAMLYEIYGETFWYLVKGEQSNKVREIYLLNPASIELKIADGELVGYVLHKNNGEQIPFTTDEIIHDKRPNPFNEWRGMSVIERASTYVDIELVTSSFTLNYMRNNASPSGIVNLPNMTKETFGAFTQQWRESYEGPENAGKTAFIRGGEANFKAVGATLKDVDAKITRDMAKEDVLMMLEVPKPLLGATDGQGFGRGNVETLYYIFAKEKIDPMMKRLDRIYESILASYGGVDLATNVTHISPIPEDKEFLLKNHTAGANVWLTVNEIRQQQGLPPVPDGDTLNVTATANQQPAKSFKRVQLKKVDKKLAVKELNDKQEEFRSNLVATNDIYEKNFKTTMSKFANSQMEKVISTIKVASKSYEEWLFGVKEESEALTALLVPVIIELMEEQSKDVANFISGEILTITPAMKHEVEAHILTISGIYNTDTIKQLEKTLSVGMSDGEGLAKLKKRVENVYTDAKGYRAERIARTETLKASNDTAEIVYKQSGFTTVKWFSNPNACEFCKALDGTVKTVGKNFLNLGDVYETSDGNKLSIDYRDINVPPLHPNCTCSLVPEA
jgi:HK97 family phage portal protein